jgi:hypothetical protein
MWSIRQEQTEAFRQYHLQKFEDEMVIHSKEVSPRLCKILGDKQVRTVVHAGMDRARGYGFTNRGPIRLFIELWYLFGSAFDSDPQYPWAGKILRASDDQMLRAEQLHQSTLDYQEEVAGPQQANTLMALKELTVLAARPFTFSSHDYVPGMLAEMARVFPQKAAYVGEEGLHAILREGGEEARKHRFSTLRGNVLLATLMFAFGHGCTRDLLYPWIARTLADERIIDSAARAARLEKKALTWLSNVLPPSSRGTTA